MKIKTVWEAFPKKRLKKEKKEEQELKRKERIGGKRLEGKKENEDK